MFLRPISASNIRTSLPCCAYSVAKLIATVVLPTPPFPLAMPITLVFFERCTSHLFGRYQI